MPLPVSLCPLLTQALCPALDGVWGVPTQAAQGTPRGWYTHWTPGGPTGPLGAPQAPQRWAPPCLFLPVFSASPQSSGWFSLGCAAAWLSISLAFVLVGVAAPRPGLGGAVRGPTRAALCAGLPAGHQERPEDAQEHRLHPHQPWPRLHGIPSHPPHPFPTCLCPPTSDRRAGLGSPRSDRGSWGPARLALSREPGGAGLRGDRASLIPFPRRLGALHSPVTSSGGDEPLPWSCWRRCLHLPQVYVMPLSAFLWFAIRSGKYTLSPR